MALKLKLIEPGKRKNNKHYLLRGTLYGVEYEFSTDKSTKAEALTFQRKFEKGLRAQAAAEHAKEVNTSTPAAALEPVLAPTPTATTGPDGEDLTFAAAARRYFTKRDPEKKDRQRIARIVALIGDKPVTEIRPHHIVEVAEQLHGRHTPATKNRHVIRPIAAILHNEADSGLCAWLRIKPFKEKKPVTRAVSRDIAAALITAAPEGARRLILMWLFRQGDRISDVLRVQWGDPTNIAGPGIDLSRQVVRLYIGKTDEWTEKQLDAEVFEMLAAIPAEERIGRLFPWKYRQGVYKWMFPLAESVLGIKVTPHMGRHSVATWANEDGETLLVIQQMINHKDMKSTARYAAGATELVRTAFARRPRLVARG